MEENMELLGEAEILCFEDLKVFDFEVNNVVVDSVIGGLLSHNWHVTQMTPKSKELGSISSTIYTFMGHRLGEKRDTTGHIMNVHCIVKKTTITQMELNGYSMHVKVLSEESTQFPDLKEYIQENLSEMKTEYDYMNEDIFNGGSKKSKCHDEEDDDNDDDDEEEDEGYYSC